MPLTGRSSGSSGNFPEDIPGFQHARSGSSASVIFTEADPAVLFSSAGEIFPKRLHNYCAVAQTDAPPSFKKTEDPGGTPGAGRRSAAAGLGTQDQLDVGLAGSRRRLIQNRRPVPVGLEWVSARPTGSPPTKHGTSFLPLLSGEVGR